MKAQPDPIDPANNPLANPPDSTNWEGIARMNALYARGYEQELARALLLIDDMLQPFKDGKAATITGERVEAWLSERSKF